MSEPVHPALADAEDEAPDPSAGPATPAQRAEVHRERIEMYLDEGDLSGPAILVQVIANGLLGIMAQLGRIATDLDKVQADLHKIRRDGERSRR